MSGPPSRQRPESVQTPVPTTVPIAEAAARLGISVDAVRKRIQRGKLTGQKTDNGWTVVWIEPDIRPDNVQTPVLESSALVDDLRDQVTYLRDQLAIERDARAEAERRHAAEIERRDVLLREALERIPQLPAALPTTPHAAPSPHRATEVAELAGDAPVPWWRFWERWG
ncbi:MAG: hypothetical protein M3R02_17930 [Chloroflexota bacterium]|nr:hypothetical protein [Chloroflexota bacterium]